MTASARPRHRRRPRASAPRSCARSPRPATTSTSPIAPRPTRPRRWPTELHGAHPGRQVRGHALDLADKARDRSFCEAIEGETLLRPRPQCRPALRRARRDDGAGQGRSRDAGQFLVADAASPRRVMRAMIRARDGPHRRDRLGRGAAGNPGNAAYAASKGALHRLCAHARDRDARSAASPSTTSRRASSTPTCWRPTPPTATEMEKQIPAGRFAKPEEVAGLVGLPDERPAPPISPARCCRSTAG